MSEASFVIAMVMFLIGSILYHLRIRWEDAKESIYRVAGDHFGEAKREHMSLYRAVELMKKDVMKASADKDIKEDKSLKEYKRCLKEYYDVIWSLRVWGIGLPLFILISWGVYKWITYIFCGI